MSALEAWHVTRTMRVLELLALRPRSAPEVANAVGVHSRTARRLLNRLVEEGYAMRTPPPRPKYGITMKLVAVGQHVLEHAELVRQAVPHVQALGFDAGARAHFSVASYRSALHLIDEHVERDACVRPQVGERVPCHCSASGHVLLAYRPRWCDSVLMRPLERYTRHTIVEPEALQARLEKVRTTGYAVENEEHVDDAGSLAAPVFDHTGQAIAALGISVPSSDLQDELLAGTVALAAGRLSEALGYVPGTTGRDDEPSAAVLEMHDQHGRTLRHRQRVTAGGGSQHGSHGATPRAGAASASADVAPTRLGRSVALRTGKALQVPAFRRAQVRRMCVDSGTRALKCLNEPRTAPGAGRTRLLRLGRSPPCDRVVASASARGAVVAKPQPDPDDALISSGSA